MTKIYRKQSPVGKAISYVLHKAFKLIRRFAEVHSAQPLRAITVITKL